MNNDETIPEQTNLYPDSKGPHIPGDDLTLEESKHFDQLADKLLPPAKSYTPPPVTGYRNLSQVEVDLMNKVKQKGIELDLLIKNIQGHLLMQRREAARLPVAQFDAELQRIDASEAARWVAIGRTHLQEGLMAVTRGIAQPSTF